MNLESKKREMEKMSRVWKLYKHPYYQECLKKNALAEEDRIFCHHDLKHFLDVARLSYIFSQERNYGLSKELIYSVALLHDIGRWQQYADGTPHDKASAVIAGKILAELEFDRQEIADVTGAIEEHRGNMHEIVTSKLSEVIYDADKMSRNCFCCEAEAECNWSEEKKNMRIIW